MRAVLGFVEQLLNHLLRFFVLAFTEVMKTNPTLVIDEVIGWPPPVPE
jgi:hypothetical protein